MAWNLESPLRHLNVHFKTIILVPKSKNLVNSSSKNEIEVFGPPCPAGGQKKTFVGRNLLRKRNKY